jgi:xanthosine utilization system XapX-like protein
MAFFTSQAEKRYVIRLAATMVAYVTSLFAMKRWLDSPWPPTGIWLDVAAVIPALPILAAIGVVGRYLVEETDEYQRTLLVRAVLWATGATLTVTTVWGFLESFAHVQPAQAGFPFMLFCVALGVAQGVGKLMERV